MYKSIETGNGDYAVIFDCDFPMLLENGLTLDEADNIAQSMQVDLDNVTAEEFQTVANF